MATEKQPISQYLTAEGKKANAVAMILFTDESPEENYIFLIKKGQQLQTPGGKVVITLAKIQQKFLISQSYSRSASPTHFQPAGEKTTANQQEQCNITHKF